MSDLSYHGDRVVEKPMVFANLGSCFHAMSEREGSPLTCQEDSHGMSGAEDDRVSDTYANASLTMPCRLTLDGTGYQTYHTEVDMVLYIHDQLVRGRSQAYMGCEYLLGFHIYTSSNRP